MTKEKNMTEEKKVNYKSNIGEKQEQEINRNIIIGLVLTILFLGFFLVVQIKMREDMKDFDSLTTPEQKLEYVEEKEQNNMDEVNYNKALTLADRAYCDAIKNSELKNTCIQEVPNYAEREPVQEISETQAMDEVNYNRAITEGNITFCQLIINESMKEQCLAIVQG